MIFSILAFLIGCDGSLTFDSIYVEKCMEVTDIIYNFETNDTQPEYDYYAQCAHAAETWDYKTKIDYIEFWSCIIDSASEIEAESDHTNEALNQIIDDCSRPI